MKKYNNTIHQIINLTPLEASKEIGEKPAFDNLQEGRQKRNPHFGLGQIVRTAEVTKTFTNADTKKWSCKSYAITEVLHDTFPSYIINYLLERYNENNLSSPKFYLDENSQLMKKLNLI